MVMPWGNRDKTATRAGEGNIRLIHIFFHQVQTLFHPDNAYEPNGAGMDREAGEKRN